MLLPTLVAVGLTFLSSPAVAAPAPQLNLDLGLGLGLNALGCLFKDPLTKHTLDQTKVWNPTTKSCLSLNACLAIKTNEVVKKSLVAGLVDLPTCVRKTCPATLALSNDGLCVCLDAQIFGDSTRSSCIPKSQCTGTKAPAGTGVTAYCAPRTCPKTLTLNKDGLCVCLSGYVYSSVRKNACIQASKCIPLLYNLVDSVCMPKQCPSGQFLSAATGLCINTCDTLLNKVSKLTGGQALCTAKTCAKGQKLNLTTGLCEVTCAVGQLLTSTKKCINVNVCNTVLNSIIGGVCTPKSSCTGSGYSLLNGVCACKSGYKLGSAGLCELPELVCKAGQLLNATRTVCLDKSMCPSALNTITPNGLCLPKTDCKGSGQTLINGACRCAEGTTLSVNVLGIAVCLDLGLSIGL